MFQLINVEDALTISFEMFVARFLQQHIVKACPAGCLKYVCPISCSKREANGFARDPRVSLGPVVSGAMTSARTWMKRVVVKAGAVLRLI